MTLTLPTNGLDRYKSGSQRARVGTECWGAENFFCPVCKSPRLTRSPHNTAAIDYGCPACNSPFQLKSQARFFGSKIVDAAYSEMKKAILGDRTPNLFVMHYDLAAWSVRNVILVPHFAFSLSVIECRAPLPETARRSGWIGCNILLAKIPQGARIPIVTNGEFHSRHEVREAYNRLRPLETLKVEKRGWTLDVLRVVQSLHKPQFTLADIYTHESDLSKLHSGNRHVRDKIRQQLQVLRDLGILRFLTRGHYSLS